jgi:hypothetical protein
MHLHFWYILIHVGLGLVGYQVFTFTNIGGIYAAGASLVVQTYAVWEIHRMAKTAFEASRAAEPSFQQRGQMLKDYHKRLARLLLFRTCIYALLTLISAMAARGGSGAG